MENVINEGLSYLGAIVASGPIQTTLLILKALFIALGIVLLFFAVKYLFKSGILKDKKRNYLWYFDTEKEKAALNVQKTKEADTRAVAEQERKKVEQNEKEKEYLIAVNKTHEKTYEQVLSMTAQNIIGKWEVGRKYARTYFSRKAFSKYYPEEYLKLSLSS